MCSILDLCSHWQLDLLSLSAFSFAFPSAQAKANRPVNLYGVPGVPSGGYQGVPAQSEPQPLHPELQAEYQKVVAGIEYRASQSLPSSPNGQPNLGRLPSAQPNLGFLPNAQPNLGLLPNPQPDSQP